MSVDDEIQVLHDPSRHLDKFIFREAGSPDDGGRVPEEEVKRAGATLYTGNGARDDLGHKIVVDERGVVRRPREGWICAGVDCVGLSRGECGRDGIVGGGREYDTLHERVTWVFVNTVVVHGDSGT